MEPLDPPPLSGALLPPTGSPASVANPEFAPSPTSDTPGHHRHPVDQPGLLPMAVFRLLAVVSFAGGFVLTGVQVYRVLDEQARSLTLSWGSMVIGLVCMVAILTWTFTTVENARRILAPAGTQELPDPWRAVRRWAVPFGFIIPATGIVVMLSQRWNTPVEGTSSSLPLLVAFVVILVALLLLYAPLAYLAGVLRQVGGQAVSLLTWAWVPVVLAAVGFATIAGLRAFGTFEDTADGIAPSWVIAVLLLLPIVVVFFVGNSAAYGFEDTVGRAYDRRVGRSVAVNRRSAQLLSIFGGERPNRTVMSTRGPVHLIPLMNPLRLGIVTLLAGLSLLNLVGAVVMFLFWRESNDGLLLPSQRDRAWEVLGQLQRAERFVAFAMVGVAMLWSFVGVYNVRLASGRRRNPLLAAAAWPLAAAGVWAVGERVADASEPQLVIAGFAVQAVIAYLPIFLLERAATAIGSRRSPFRIVYALGVVMFVYVHGLGGLWTLEEVADTAEFGRLAGYLALGALVLLLSTLAVTEASQSISDTCTHEAQRHNFLAAQRQPADAPVAERRVGPSVAAE